MASAGVSAQWYLGPISSTAKKKENNEKEKGKAEDKEKGKDNDKQGASSHTCSIQRRKKDEGRKKTVQYGQESVVN